MINTRTSQQSAPNSSALHLLLLMLIAAALPAFAEPNCAQLRNRQQQLATEAIRSEMALVLATRRRLCPGVEAQAEHPEAAASGALDFDAYIHCRAKTEALLKRTRPVLYTNHKGFIFYTAQGARLAREADALTAECTNPETPIQTPDQREKSAS